MRTHRPDYFFISLVWILVGIGLACLLSASLIMGRNNFNDPYYYVKHQILFGGLIGLVGFLIMSKIYYRRLEKWAFPILIIAIILMLLVFTPFGLEIKGARRWVQIGPLPQFQPSEFLKIACVIYISAWLANRISKMKKMTRGIIPLIIFLAIVCGLLVMQKSTSTLLILFISSIAILFLSGIKIRYLIFLCCAGVILVAALAFIRPYILNRILSFVNQGNDIQGRDYQVNQSLIAIGSGGLGGVGFGNAVSKYNYLPEPMGDSIFAVVAQEFGFVGSLILVSLYFLFFVKGLNIARNSPDSFAKLLGAGLMIMIFFQTVINIGAMTKLIPLTGQPLPFISYGGTNLAVLLTSMGIIVNISKHTRKV